MSASERHRRVMELFDRACECPRPERSALLEGACADDTALRREVELLLKHDEKPIEFIEATEHGQGMEVLAADLAADAESVESSEPDAAPPERIGRYRIRRKVAEGGMGAVYEAEQDNPRRIVALKTLLTGVQSASMIRRFQREIKLLGRLQHPGIAQIFDAGTAQTDDGAIPYFTMEFVHGRTLTAHADARDLGSRERLELIALVCDAVQYAHQKGVIHRDLKPGNIFVLEGGAKPAHPNSGIQNPELTSHPKILDFGVARAIDSDENRTTVYTDVGQLIGTLPYMSPEQVAGAPEDIDTRSDVYSLGVVMYELLTGRVPLDVKSRSVPEAVRVIREEEPRRLSSFNRSLRGDVETIVRKALEKDRDRRYASASELAADIRRYLNDEPIVARPATTLYQLRKFARRHRGFVVGVAVALVALFAAVVASSWWAIAADRARDAEVEQRRLADDAAGRARAGETAMKWLAYRSGITAAQALMEADPTEARRQLDGLPVEHRNWEWRYISARLGTPLIRVDPPAACAWRSDGTPIAAAVRGSRLEIIDLRTRDPIRTLPCDTAVKSPLFSPGGEFLFARSATKASAWIWDVATGRLLHTLPMNDKTWFGFSPDGATFWFNDLDKRRLSVIETVGGRIRAMLTLPEDARARYSHDGRHLTIRSQGRVATFDIESGQLTEPWKRDVSKIRSTISRDGTRLAEWIGSAAPIAVMNADSREELLTLDGNIGGTLGGAFSLDARYFASGGFDEALRIWDLADGRELRSIVLGQLYTFAFSPDGSQLLAGNSGRGEPAFLWQWRRPPPAMILHGHTNYIYLVAFSPDGSLIASAGWDESVRLWDGTTGAPRASLPFRGHHVHGLGFSDDGSRVIAAIAPDIWEATNFVVWNVADHRRTDDSRITYDSESRQKLRDPTPEDRAFFWDLAVGGSKTVRYDGGENFTTSHDRALLARPAAGARGHIAIIDRMTGQELRRLAGHEGAVRAVAFSPDDSLLASGGDDGAVRVWNVKTGAQLAAMTGHTHQIYTVTFSPDGTRIASGGNDNSIRLWDTETYKQVAVLTGHTSYVHSLRFSPDGARLVSGSGDHSVRIWSSLPHPARVAEKRSDDIESN